MSEQVVYAEPARGWGSAVVLGLVLLAGWGLDFVLGGGAEHALAWVVALVVVVGFDVLAIRAVRATRSITVTRAELRLGEHVLDRAGIAGLSTATDAEDAPVFGRSMGEGIPRGSGSVALELHGGSTVLIASRFPDRLAAALAVRPAPPEVRLAESEELAELPEVERRSDTVFTVVGLGPLPPASTDYADAIAVFVAGTPVYGFARLDEVDGHAHLEQLSVLPSRMRQGVGTALVEAAAAWAAAAGYAELSLVTFRDVAWNAPFYRRVGFAEVPQPSPVLEQLRAVDLGVPGARIVMSRRLEHSDG